MLQIVLFLSGLILMIIFLSMCLRKLLTTSITSRPSRSNYIPINQKFEDIKNSNNLKTQENMSKYSTKKFRFQLEPIKEVSHENLKEINNFDILESYQNNTQKKCDLCEKC